MGRPRKFDHDEARRLYRAGWTKTELARFFGVSHPSIANVVDERVARAQREWHKAIFAATCDECGGACSKNWYAERVRLDRTLCQKCYSTLLSEEALLARHDEHGNLRCGHCGAYKPLEEYRIGPSGSPFKRCRLCETEARRDWRHRNRERENAWQREYKRKRRQAVA